MAQTNLFTEGKYFKPAHISSISNSGITVPLPPEPGSIRPLLNLPGSKEIPGRDVNASSNYYKELYENAPYTTMFISNDSIIERCNRHSEQLLGYRRDEITGRHFTDLYAGTPYGKAKASMVFKLIIAGKPVTDVELQMQGKEGGIFWVSQSLYPIINEKNVNTGCVSVIINIDKRKKAEDRVKEQNKFLKSVIESLTHPFYVIDADDYSIKLANSAARCGPSPADPTCYQLTHKRERPCDSANHPCPLQEVKELKEPFIAEHIHYNSGGEKRNIEVHAYPIFDKSGKVIQILEYSLDITERKKAEEEIRRLSNEIISSQEKERERVAKDLHDGVVQTILAAKLNFKAFQKEPEESGDRFEMGLMFIDKANRELREIYTDLYPSILNDIGLEATIKWHVKNTLELHGIKTYLRFNISDRPAHDIEVNLYRMVQEISSNIIKYSEADRVEMELVQQNGYIALTVADNGKGFLIDEVKRGYGLSNLRQRSESFGGVMNVDAAPGKGTRISITIKRSGIDEEGPSLSC